MNVMLRIEPDGTAAMREWAGLVYAVPDPVLRAIGREHGADGIGLFVAPSGTHAALVIDGEELSDSVSELIVGALIKRQLLPSVTYRVVNDPRDLL